MIYPPDPSELDLVRQRVAGVEPDSEPEDEVYVDDFVDEEHDRAVEKKDDEVQEEIKKLQDDRRYFQNEYALVLAKNKDAFNRNGVINDGDYDKVLKFLQLNIERTGDKIRELGGQGFYRGNGVGDFFFRRTID